MKKFSFVGSFFPLPAYRKWSMHPLWNLWLLTAGSAFIALGVQGIAAHHGFLTGGVLGLGLLVWYATDLLNAPTWSLLFNIPLILFSWFHVGKRFVLYSVYGTVAIYVWSLLMDRFSLPFENPLYAAVMAGALGGTGGGIMLRSLGSGGGIDFLAVYLNRKLNIPIGRFAFFVNACIFLASITTISLDMVIVSFIMVFISSSATDYVLRMFNQRKIVFVVTSRGQEICDAIIAGAGRATILPAYGGYSHEAKEVVMTVTTNFTLRHLEDMVYAIDPHALFAVENTFYVSGSQYPRPPR
jgi:uncharacterized membrane-anchored protein YitT (DUF2179 family)